MGGLPARLRRVPLGAGGIDTITATSTQGPPPVFCSLISTRNLGFSEQRLISGPEQGRKSIAWNTPCLKVRKCWSGEGRTVLLCWSDPGAGERGPAGPGTMRAESLKVTNHSALNTVGNHKPMLM